MLPGSQYPVLERLADHGGPFEARARLDGMPRSDIRLPCSGSSQDRFLKLLSRVDPDAENGFGFEGRLLPGKTATAAALRPSADFPETPIVLEYSHAEARGIPGNRRRDGLYVLWRWERQAGSWRELGRARSVAWEWAIDLRPLALRALAEARSRPPGVEAVPDLGLIAARISEFIEKELCILPALQQARVLAALHDELAKRSSGNRDIMGRRAA